MSMIENHVSGNLYNKRFSEISEEKCTVFQIMDWYLIVHQNLHHLSPGLSLSLSLSPSLSLSLSFSLYPLFQDIFKHFAKFIGKLLCQSLSFNKVVFLVFSSKGVFL